MSATSEIKIGVFNEFGNVGKSNLVIRFVQNGFCEVYDPTIEDSYRKEIEIDGMRFFVDILDQAGCESFYYRATYMNYFKCDGYLLVFSVSNRDSFLEMEKMRNFIINEFHKNSTNNIPFVLAANKCDLPHSEYQVTIEEIENLASSLNIPYFLTSAKENINVSECFYALIREVLKVRNSPLQLDHAQGGYELSQESLSKESKKCSIV